MTQILAILGMVALSLGLATVSALWPCYLSDDGNSFLKNFVNQELLSFLGVIVTITLASAANLHLEFNRLQDRTREGFPEARSAVKAYAILLMVLFAGAFVLVILKPLFASDHITNAGFNSVAIVIVALSILSLADLTLAIFRIPPLESLDNDDKPS